MEKKVQERTIPKKTLEILYNSAKNAKNDWDTNQNIDISYKPIAYEKRDFTKMKDFDLIPEKIKNYIVNLGHYLKVYVINIEERTYNISLMYYGEDNNKVTMSKISSYFSKAIKRIFLWLHMVQPFSNKDCSKIVDVCIWMTPFQKVFPEKSEEPLGEMNINTAFTSSCLHNKSKIYIYRKEEWYKVLIHETFHVLGLDFSNSNIENSEDQLSKIFNVQSNRGIRAYECYCESWSEIIYLFLHAFNKHSINKDTCFALTNKLFNKQIEFSVYQMVKILKYYQLTYDELLDMGSGKKLVEDSHILSYYILKFACLFNVCSFLDWCEKNNTNILNFKKTQDNIDSFISLLITFHNKPKMIKYIRNYKQNVQEQDVSLRMIINIENHNI